MNKKKKKVLALAAILAMLIYHSVDYQYKPDYEIYETTDSGFGRYSKGNVYIGDAQYLRSLTGISDRDVLVLDQRDGINPNMKVINSASIMNKEEINEILEILCRYEECYPSDWDRSIESMRLEWFMHNASYKFMHEIHRTIDVDLDNNEEDEYNNCILRKIFKL